MWLAAGGVLLYPVICSIQKDMERMRFEALVQLLQLNFILDFSDEYFPCI